MTASRAGYAGSFGWCVSRSWRTRGPAGTPTSPRSRGSTTTPAAVVSRGTLPDQEIGIATLEEIADVAGDLPGPALVVIGDVVALSGQLGLQRRRTRLEDAPDAAHGLADPVLVLDEREPDEALASRAEARSR